MKKQLMDHIKRSSLFQWCAEKRDLIGDVCKLLVRVFLWNPVIWILYFLIGVVVLMNQSVTYQHQRYIKRIMVTDRVQGSSDKWFILGQDVDRGTEVFFTIQDLFHYPKDRTKLSYLYLKCAPGRILEIIYCADDNEKYIIDVKEVPPKKEECSPYTAFGIPAAVKE